MRAHTTTISPNDAAVIIMANGDELHLPVGELVTILDTLRQGNDMMMDDAHDQPAEDRPAAIELCQHVEGVLEWIEAAADLPGTPMCTGEREPIDTPAVHQRLRDTLDLMIGRGGTVVGIAKAGTIPGTTDHGNGLVSIDTDED